MTKLNRELNNKVLQLAQTLRNISSSPKYFPGCEVTSIARIDQYADNNGWINCQIQQDNNQPCRYFGNPINVQVNDVVDILYFPDTKSYFVFSLGGTSAVGGIPLDGVRVSKLVASDGDPDPVLSSNATGALTAIGNLTLAGLIANSVNAGTVEATTEVLTVALTATSDITTTGGDLTVSNGDLSVNGFVDLENISVPSAPATDNIRIYTNNDKAYVKDESNLIWPIQPSIGEALAQFLALPMLRGFWPMSSVSSGEAIDISGNARLLSYNGNPTYNYSGLVPYIDLDGTGDYLSRADEAGLDIVGTETYVASTQRGLTFGGWFYNNEISLQGLIGKYINSGSRSYIILTNTSGGNYFFQLNVNSGAGDTVVQSNTTYADPQWVFAVARFDPSTEIAIFSNNSKTVNTTSIPSSLANSTAAFTIGAASGGTIALNGRASMCFLCAAALSDAIIANLFTRTRAMFGV